MSDTDWIMCPICDALDSPRGIGVHALWVHMIDVAPYVPTWADLRDVSARLHEKGLLIPEIKRLYVLQQLGAE